MNDIKRKIYRELLIAPPGGESGGQRERAKPALFVSDESWAPPTDILETEQHVLVIMEIGGIQPEEVDIHYENGRLTVSGNREHLPGVDLEKITYFHKKEIDMGHFQVQIKITRRILSESIRARYQEGFLIIELPKDTRSSRTSDISVDVE